MRVWLHYKTKDFEPGLPLPWNSEALVTDLDLGTLFTAMAGGDEFLMKMARVTILTGLDNDADTIAYRQDILRDCLAQPEAVRALYDIAVAALEAKKGHWFSFGSRYPSSVLSSAVGLMELLADYLGSLRQFAEQFTGKFQSEGFRRLLSSFRDELGPDYLKEVGIHLEDLRFRRGLLISGSLGAGNKGIGYVLRRLSDKSLPWWKRLFAGSPKGVYTFALHPRDESGARALSALRDEGIARAAAIMEGAAGHVLAFFTQLRAELAFYLGGLNLREKLATLGEDSCFPSTEALRGEKRYSCAGLYDPCLALNMNRRITGNDLDDAGKGLVIITGANQGGKSTFLRSVG
ncbi:MAG TPA: hypothetical protein VHE54_19690, partial [Puia sp.]|nr:hypothetical protein [Puia sp.]